MKLIYKDSKEEVKVGDRRQLDDGIYTVEAFEQPYKPSSQGKITVKRDDDDFAQTFYVSVIGAEWIDREDQIDSVSMFPEESGPDITQETAQHIQLHWNNYCTYIKSKRGSAAYRKAHFDYLEGVIATLKGLGYKTPVAIKMCLLSYREYGTNKPI